MKTIQTRVRVTGQGTLTARVPEDVPPGEWDAVLVLDAVAGAQQPSVAPRTFGDLLGAFAGRMRVSEDDLAGAEYRSEWNGESLP